MNKISPEAQALIDRLARMNPANPRQDKAAIERAITLSHLARGNPLAPFVWAKDATEMFRLGDTLPGWRHGEGQAMLPPWDEYLAASRVAEKNEAWSAADESGSARARQAARIRAWDSAGGIVNQSENALPVAWHAIRAVGTVNGRAAFDHPASARLVAAELPAFEAFEAGLFAYWILPNHLICLLQPSLCIENGQLHCADGPAVAWPSGDVYYFWRGVRVPRRVIEQPEQITVEMIQKARNQEIRRALTEIYGRSRICGTAARGLSIRMSSADFGKSTEAVVSVGFSLRSRTAHLSRTEHSASTPST